MSPHISSRPVTVLILTLLAVAVGLSLYLNVRHSKNARPQSSPTAADSKHAHLLSEGQQLHLQIIALRLDRRFDDAIPIAQRALRIREEFPGKQSLEYAQALNDLGFLYRFTEQYEQAEKLLTEALALERAVLGHDGLESAETLNYLGSLYEAKEDFSHAQQDVSLALSIGEKYGGPLHPEVATSLARLGSIYRHQKSYSTSEAMLKRAMEIDELHASAGKSTEVSRDLYFLATLYKDTRDFDKALQLTDRLLKLDESIHPPYNLQISVDLSLQAEIYTAADRLADAESNYKQVIEIDKRWYGSRDLTIASDYEDLANVYELEDKYSDAEVLRTDILALDRENSETTEGTTDDLNHLAELYSYMGRYQDAINVDQQALKLDLTLEGEDRDNALSLVCFMHERCRDGLLGTTLRRWC